MELTLDAAVWRPLAYCLDCGADDVRDRMAAQGPGADQHELLDHMAEADLRAFSDRVNAAVAADGMVGVALNATEIETLVSVFDAYSDCVFSNAEAPAAPDGWEDTIEAELLPLAFVARGAE